MLHTNMRCRLLDLKTIGLQLAKNRESAKKTSQTPQDLESDSTAQSTTSSPLPTDSWKAFRSFVKTLLSRTRLAFTECGLIAAVSLSVAYIVKVWQSHCNQDSPAVHVYHKGYVTLCLRVVMTREASDLLCHEDARSQLHGAYEWNILQYVRTRLLFSNSVLRPRRVAKSA